MIAALDVGGGSVSYSWPTALPVPQLSGATATFSGVRPGVDLVATVTTTGVEASLVFQNQSAASAGPVNLTVTTAGLTATMDSTGAVSYADANGSVLARTPTPQAWDTELGGDVIGPGGGPVDVVPNTLTTSSGAALAAGTGAGTVTAASGTMTDQLQVPSGLLDSASTVYPLVLDPGVNCTNCSEGVHGYVECPAPRFSVHLWCEGSLL